MMFSFNIDKQDVGVYFQKFMEIYFGTKIFEVQKLF